MKLDDTLIKILTTIQLEVAEQFGIEYGIEDLHNMVNSQIEATKLGLSRGISVHWSRFCKFVYTNKMTNQVQLHRFVERVAINEELLPHEKEELIKQRIIEASVEKRRLLSLGSRSNRFQGTEGWGKESTVEDILSTPIQTPVKTTLFINLIHKHNK